MQLSSILLAIPCLAVNQSTTPTPAKLTPFTLDSIHYGVEATVAGSVRNDQGQPAGDAQVILRHSRHGWGGGQTILGTTRTDSDGRFHFDVTSFEPGTTYLEVLVDEFHRMIQEPVQLTTGSWTHVGPLQAVGVVSIEGTFSSDAPTQNAGGKGYQAIQLLEGATSRVAGYARIEDGTFRISGVPRKPLTLNYLESKRRESTPIDLTDWPRRSRVDVTLQNGVLSFQHQPIEGHPPAPEDNTTVLAGTIVDGDGLPLAGLQVRATPQNARVPVLDEGAVTTTDAEGRFRLEVSEFQPTQLWLYGSLGSTRVTFQPAKYTRYGEKAYTVPASEAMDIRLADAIRLDLPRTVANSNQGERSPISYAVYRNHGWTDTDWETARISLGRGGSSLRAQMPGRFPRAIQPSAGEGKGLDTLEFEEHRVLQVHSGGEPLPEARVALWQHLGALNLRMPDGVYLGRLSLDHDGTYGGYAPKGLHYTAIVTAPGFAPQVVRLHGSGEFQVDLAPCSTQVRFQGARPGQTVVVQSTAGRPIWSHRRLKKEALPLQAVLPPGSYDFILLNSDLEVLAGQPLEVLPHEGKKDIQVTDDKRRRLRLTLPPPVAIPEEQREQFAQWYSRPIPPESEWLASVSRSIGPGSNPGAMGSSFMGSGPAWEVPCAHVVRDGPQAREITFHVRGDVWIHLQDAFAQLPGVFQHEWTISSDQPTTLQLPTIQGQLHGSMREFRRDLSDPHHGVAGPRLWIGSPMEAGRRTGWSIKVPMPGRNSPGSPEFTVSAIPVGTYWIQDHLTDGGFRGQQNSYGAMPVSVAGNGQITRLPDFSVKGPFRVPVRVQHADGTPFQAGHVQHVDPMHSAWSEFSKAPTTGVYASAPIPRPRLYPLSEEGRANISRIRHPLVILDLHAFDGWSLRAAFEVDPEKPEVCWTLPEDLGR